MRSVMLMWRILALAPLPSLAVVLIFSLPRAPRSGLRSIAPVLSRLETSWRCGVCVYGCREEGEFLQRGRDKLREEVRCTRSKDYRARVRSVRVSPIIILLARPVTVGCDVRGRCLGTSDCVSASAVRKWKPRVLRNCLRRRLLERCW